MATQTQSSGQTTKVRDPRYRVFELCDVLLPGGGPGHEADIQAAAWIELTADTGPIRAATDKDAIKAATSVQPRGGRFATVLEGAWRERSRAMVLRDDWS